MKALIITHGVLGEELKRTAELVLGNSEGLDAVSNTDLSRDDLAERLETLLAAEPKENPIFIFVDLLGGSCAQASTGLLKDRPAARLITGVNLPMIIAFLQYRDTMSANELAAAILMRGHRGICALPALD